MVLRVCRSILGNQHDAEDAFQATFLVLVRRAAAVAGTTQSVAGCTGSPCGLRPTPGPIWLVAAGTSPAPARRRLPGIVPTPKGYRPTSRRPSMRNSDNCRERYRAAIVLCYLEGHTCEAAARRLGWPVGTVKSRLARGRKRLADGCSPRAGSGRRVGARRSGPYRDHSRGAGAHHGRGNASFCQRTVDRRRRLGSFALLGSSRSEDHANDQTRHDLGRVNSGRCSGWHRDSRRPTARGAETTSAAFKATPVQKREPGKPAVPDNKVEMLSVRVVDPRGRDVANVIVKVVEFDATPADDGPGFRTGAYRTGADGRVRVAVDRHFSQVMFESRPDDRTQVGRASFLAGCRRRPRMQILSRLRSSPAIIRSKE